MSGRDAILAGLRASLGRDGAAAAAAQTAVDERLARRGTTIRPARGDNDRGRVKRFIAEAERASANVVRLKSMDEVPAAVATWLRLANLPARLKRAADPLLDALGWDDTALEVQRGVAVDADSAGLSVASAAVAETGTLALASGPTRPTTLNFLPETHFVVVPEGHVVGAYEDVLASVRDEMPATLNFITGPSRSGDIEQTIQLGAHGPRRLVILMVEADGEASEAT
ncbi:MAG: lactate utilization protein [Alphaproteobacteria bacterium]